MKERIDMEAIGKQEKNTIHHFWKYILFDKTTISLDHKMNYQWNFISAKMQCNFDAMPYDTNEAG